jgi:hypothetical protein
MLGSLFNRRVIHTAVMWTMMPLALLNGRMLSGCISPDGRFNPGCNCCAVAIESAHAVKSCCRCCPSGHCTRSCCKGKSLAHMKLPAKSGSGFTSSSCQAVAQYLVIPTIVKNAPATNDQMQAAVDIAAFEFSVFLVGIPQREPDIDSTPPPNNLVISLQRFLI